MKPAYPFFPLSLCLLSLLTFHASTKDINLIHQTCKNSTQQDPNINYTFCTTSLESAPDSNCASRQQLGMISLRLIKYNVTNTRCYITELLKNKRLDPYIKQCLMDCFDLYSDAIPTLEEAMQDYQGKKYVDANIQVSAAMEASTTCEDGFKEKKGVVSPLTKRNNDAFELSAIALSIMNMVR